MRKKRILSTIGKKKSQQKNPSNKLIRDIFNNNNKKNNIYKISKGNENLLRSTKDNKCIDISFLKKYSIKMLLLFKFINKFETILTKITIEIFLGKMTL